VTFPVVVVFWGDAHEKHEDVDVADIEHEPKVQAIAGWLIKQDDVGVTIATEYGVEDGELRTVNFIPAGMIQSLELVRQGNK